MIRRKAIYEYPIRANPDWMPARPSVEQYAPALLAQVLMAGCFQNNKQHKDDAKKKRQITSLLFDPCRKAIQQTEPSRKIPKTF
jgi:hypothetical protein